MSDTTPDSTRTPGPAAGTGAGAPALVDVSWLAEHLGEPGLVVLDATMGPSPSSPRIPGARWFDHDEAMAAPGSDLPHTLPGIEHFQEQVRRLGVDDAGHVVVYDGTGIFSSPRARWMLRQAGHGRVSVLDGGLRDRFLSPGSCPTASPQLPTASLQFPPHPRSPGHDVVGSRCRQ